MVLQFVGSLRAGLLSPVTLLKTSFFPCRKLTITVTYTNSLFGVESRRNSVPLLGSGKRLRAFTVWSAVVASPWIRSGLTLVALHSVDRTLLVFLLLTLDSRLQTLRGGVSIIVCCSSELADRFCYSRSISWRSLFSIIFNDWASWGPCTCCPLACPFPLLGFVEGSEFILSGEQGNESGI